MEEENIGRPFVKKEFYENCPGCKVDRAKELTTNVSTRNLLYLWMAVLCGTLPVSSLFPFVYFMVKDFNVAEREEDISAYAGYVGSAFMLGRALTSILWGMLSDHYGRKPVIIIGVITVVIFNTLFGLSTNLWMAVSMRFLLGSLNGLLGPIKRRAASYRTLHSRCSLGSRFNNWSSIGRIFGSVVKYPHLFPKDSFWDKFPYFLPCFVISVFAFAVAIACIWLPETLHNHNSSNEFNDKVEALERGSNGPNKDKMIKKNENIFLNWPLMSSIIVYCVFSLHDIAYQEVFSLWAVSPRRLGGLNFTTNDVGNVLAISGIAIIIYQLSLYPSVQKACGPVTLARTSGVLSIPLLQCYAFLPMLSGFTLYLVINIASIFKNIMTETIATGLFMLQNRAVEQHQRGAANGIAMTAMSAFKSIGPAGGGAILAWSQRRLNASFLPGVHMVFFALNVVEGLGVLLMFKPFLSIKKKTPPEH